MSSVESLLSSLRRSGVKLWVEGDELRYRAPQAVLSRVELDELRRRKAEIVGFLQQARDLMGRALPPLVARPRSAVVPLSYAQERLWFLEQLGLVGSAYHIAAAVRLDGALDVGALERGIGEVVRRHESLRTRFAAVDGQGIQVIEAAQAYRLEVVDLTELGPEAGANEARRRAQAQAAERFDLAAGPLLRVKLLRLGAEHHVMLVNMHHIVSDGWSMGVMVREIGTLYAAYAAGRSSPLADPTVHYADYALWQRDWLAGEVLARQVGYWKERLAGAPAALELPTDRARPAVQSFAGGAVEFALPARLSAGLAELSRREGATLYMVLLAAFALLLCRYSGQHDVVVGSPIAGRRHRELEQLIGFFVNTLVLRTDLSGDPSFRALLGRVKETALGAYAHQDLPFEKLVEELKPPRDLSRQPLFQVTFALQNAPAEELRLPGLNVSRVSSGRRTAKYDLALVVRTHAPTLTGKFEYATALFEAATIARLAGHFERLLEGIVADPQRPISELPMLSEAERHRLVVEYNDTAADYPRQCVHELFAAQSARTPDAIALVCAEAQLSYGELDRRANRLAHYLRERGVGPEVVVGLCVERSAAMVIGVLGILKAGGAYLPLEPSYPPERLAYMLGDAKALLLLTQTQLAERLPPHPAQLLCLDAHWQDIARQPAAAPVSLTTPDNLAYVIYTSGSTGRPKGVMGIHRTIANRLHWDATGDTAGEVYAQKTAAGFIDSLWEIFMPLVRGQSGTMVPEPTARDPDALTALLARRSATRIVVVPSMLRVLLEASDELIARLSQLRYWACSGEALPAQLVGKFKARFSRARLFNIYGTSEFWDATWCETSAEDEARDGYIGRPIANMQTVVLDRSMQPVPLNVTAELFVGGAGLGRGYLNRPGLTAERFLPDPFSVGRRLYRTSDLAKRVSDGALVFAGRRDQQVKIRGFRIELGEIEAALISHPTVEQAVVTAPEETPGERRLAAYVVGRHGIEPQLSDLRAHLKQSLPDHMIPSAFVTLDALPLTTSGKIDRQALPVPERRLGLGQYVAPSTPTEQTLASIWREVMNVDHVGMDDNFFELGGHSLLLVRVQAAIARTLDLKIPITTLFRFPSIRSLSQHLDSEENTWTAVQTGLKRAQARRVFSRLDLAGQGKDAAGGGIPHTDVRIQHGGRC
jgi:amino acid adenylation domain-containing protein